MGRWDFLGVTVFVHEQEVQSHCTWSPWEREKPSQPPAKGEAQASQDGTMGSCFWIIVWALLTHSFSPWQEEAGEEQSCLCWG